jgi:hypothetical protein
MMQGNSRRIGKTVLMLTMFCFAWAQYGTVSFAQQSTAVNRNQRQQIIVKIRNAKTGLPIWIASPYVFLGKTDPQRYEQNYRRTQLWGDAHVDVAGVNPREVRVWIDYLHQDCRYSEADYKKFLVFDFGGITLNSTDTYNLDTILSTGIVAHNYCNARTQKPEPGVLTIYVIPESFKELWEN